MSPVTPVKSAVPTKKWAVTQITAVAALLVMWATTGSWDTEETVALIGLVSQAGIGYLTPNADTPGGVPLASRYRD
jgi:hypothetical protein